MSNPYIPPCWKVLGIDPTEDAGAVKRAYAKRLKAVRPDEDPEGFQELREAYETALAATATSFSSTAPLDFSAPPSYAPRQQVTLRFGPDFQSAPADRGERSDILDDEAAERPMPMPRPVYRFADQPLPVDARALAIAAWQRFLERCEPLLRHADQGGHSAPLTETAQVAGDYLAETMRSPEMELLETKAIFQQIAVQYCLGDQASSVIRVGCLHGLRWEEEQRASGAFTQGLEAYAFERAVGDREYHLLLETARRSKATAALLQPGPPVIPWRRMYHEEFRNDLRNCLTEIRGRLHQAERFWLGTDKVQAWIDALERPWPSMTFTFGLFALGLLLGVSVLSALRDGFGPDSFFAQTPVALTIWAFVALLLPAAVLVYPRYVYPLVNGIQQRMLADRRIELANYLAHVAMATLVLGLEQLPPGFSSGFIFLALALCLFNIFLKSKFNFAQIIFLAMMAAVLAMPILDALRPLAGDTGVAIAILLGGLFLGPRTLAMRYGIDLYNLRIRLGLLLAIVVIFGLQFALKEINPSQWNPVLTVLLFAGWWWILLAAGASDPMLLFLHDHRISGMLWLPALALLYYLPRILDFGGPLEGIMRLEISVAAALVSVLIWTKAKGA